ncbi:Zinc finger protein [Pseudolycoriella hygida]|uniref:Zinc finger protein n=1 Tax=Pseudolycoriella hygida TaxID=35572 RepID=A0A9Q0NGR2_9DIPT|nr:Zinc finger protein [Pseudolycoriella hygida]
MEDLTRENLSSICRLCLQLTNLSISIYDRKDPNPNKKPLKDRIFEMYAVKVSASDGLPINICHHCLYYTEMYTDFREKVRQCEIKLQNFIAASALEQSVAPISERKANGVLVPSADDNITVIDPNIEYQSSDDECSTSDIENVMVPPPVKQQKNTKVNRFKTQQIKNVFFCEYCDKAFVNQEECFRHEVTNHDQQNPHICTFCKFTCSSRITIIAHIKECHDPKPFFCTQCSKKFGRRSDLRKHSVVHTGIRPFRCKVCNKHFSRNTNLTKHLRIHEKTQVKSGDAPQSVDSSRTRNDTENMIISLDPFNDQDSNVGDDNHSKGDISLRGSTAFDRPESVPPSTQQNNHMSRAPMPVFLPPIHMPLPNPINIPAPKPSIPVPVQTIEPIEIEPEPESSISLLLKGNVSTDTTDFARHVTGDAVTFRPNKANKEPVIKPRIFFCESCPKKFATQSSLLNHRNSHTSIRTRSHTCTICNKSFIRKRELDRHSTIHTTNRPFSCASCPKKFGRKDKLVRHEKTHLEFFCPNCHLSFSRKDAMFSHMKVHESNDNIVHDEMINSMLRPNNDIFNLMNRPQSEYDAPINLVLTEQPSVKQNVHSFWPPLDHYKPFP